MAAGGKRQPSADFTGVILAGGKGRRLNCPKPLLDLTGRPLIEDMLEKHATLFRKVLIVVDREDSELGCYAGEHVRLVPDLVRGKGPLGGIYTALDAASSEFIFVMACDMPFACLELAWVMMERAPGHQAVVPRQGNLIEPLFAVYRRDILPEVGARVARGDLKIHELLDALDVAYVEDEVQAADPSGLCFFNINTDRDLQRARRFLRP